MRLEGVVLFVFVLLGALFALSSFGPVSLSGFAVHEDYPSFSALGGRGAVDALSLSFSDDAVFGTAYVSVDGGVWSSLPLSGSSYPGAAGWLSGGVIASLPSALGGAGEHYVIVYSCSWSDGWDCHGTTDHPEGYWQLVVINNSAAAPSSFMLVEDGVALADIVVSPDAPGTVQLAAKYFQEYAAGITGASLPLRSSPGDDFGFHVYIGSSQFTRELGITAQGTRDDGFRMVSGDDFLVLIGDDTPFKEPPSRTTQEWDELTGEQWIDPGLESYSYNYQYGVWDDDGWGTMNAVVEFFYDQGVRWYYPLEEDIIIPSRQYLSSPSLDRLVNPDFALRDYFLYFKKISMLGSYWYPDDYEALMRWYTSLRSNKFPAFPFVHGINYVIRRQNETRPEYFALVDGERLTSGWYAAPDLCNQELLQENVRFVETMVEVYNASIVSVMPSDGFTQVSESSPECAAWEDPSRGSMGYLSDYVWEYVNNVAWAVYEKYGEDSPKILCGAYTTYMLPPQRLSRPFAPNVVASIARARSNYMDPERKQFYDDMVAQWYQLLPSHEVYMYDYLLQNRLDSNTESVPFLFPHIIAEDLRYLKGKSQGEFVEVQTNSYQWDLEWDTFAANSLNVYVASRLWWDADQDVDALLEEYYDLYYGPAREEMKALVEFSEANAYLATSDPSVLSTMRGMAQDALATAGADTIYGRRIERLLALINSSYEGEEASVDTCGNLSQTGVTYSLTRNVSAPGTCFVIDADGVTLDCQGHSITYSTAGGAKDSAIYNDEFFTYRGDYFTIKNCVIQDGSYLSGEQTGPAIYLSHADKGMVVDTFINVSGRGVRAVNSLSNSFLRNEVHAAEGEALVSSVGTNFGLLISSSDFENNTFSSTQNHAIYLFGSHNNTFTRNVLVSPLDPRVWLTASENNTFVDNVECDPGFCP